MRLHPVAEHGQPPPRASGGERGPATPARPSLDGERCLVHALYAPQPAAGDLRGRASRTPWPDLLVTKIRTNFPDFELADALDDTYLPMQAAAHATGSPFSLEAVS